MTDFDRKPEILFHLDFSEIIIFTLKITIFMMIFEIQFHGFIGVVSTKNSNFENFRKFSNRENNGKFRIQNDHFPTVRIILIELLQTRNLMIDSDSREIAGLKYPLNPHFRLKILKNNNFYLKIAIQLRYLKIDISLEQ